MPSAKILIVEDDALVAYDLQKVLEEKGYEVLENATTFEDVKKTLHQEIPDVVLMDVNFESSQYDGMNIARYLLDEYAIHVIFLTAYSGDDLIKRAAALNPHGYLLKPFDESALVAMVKLALYKQNILDSEDRFCFEIGQGYCFDLEKEMLFSDETPVKLGKNEKRLLMLMMRTPGEVVTFRQIENIVYEGKLIGDSTIRTLIYRLRSKLGGCFVQTVNTLGCKLLIKS